MLDLWSPVSKKKTEVQDHFVQRIIRKIEGTGTSKPLLIIFIFAVLSITLLVGLSKLKVDSNFVEVIKEGLPLRDTYTLVDRYMAGTGNMEILIDLKKEDAMKDPDVLGKIDMLQGYIKKHHSKKIIKTISLVNVAKDSYKALNEGKDEMYIIPADPMVLEQTLFLFNNANPKDRRRLVSDDYSKGRVGIHSVNVGSIESIELMDRMQSFMDDEFHSLKQKYPDLEITLTGNMALLSIMLDYISWSQIKSFGMALIVISIVLLIVLGSIKAGLIAMVPNLFPILMTFGLMGFLKIPLDADTLIIAPIIIGLAVDDTIHFLAHFRLEVKKFKDIKKATLYAIREAGQAITFTTLILSIGFLVFIFSFHNGLSHFGIFSAVAIITALLSDLFLLPALCMTFNMDFKKKESGALSTSSAGRR